MKPSLGRIVLVHGTDLPGPDREEHPAIITKVWSDICVNVTVFQDYDIVKVKSSVMWDGDLKEVNGWRWPPRND